MSYLAFHWPIFLLLVYFCLTVLDIMSRHCISLVATVELDNTNFFHVYLQHWLKISLSLNRPQYNTAIIAVTFVFALLNCLYTQLLFIRFTLVKTSESYPQDVQNCDLPSTLADMKGVIKILETVEFNSTANSSLKKLSRRWITGALQQYLQKLNIKAFMKVFLGVKSNKSTQGILKTQRINQ